MTKMRRSSSLASSLSGGDSVNVGQKTCQCQFRADLAGVGCCFKDRFLTKIVFLYLVDESWSRSQDEGVACQMVGCELSRAKPFKDTVSMLRHLKECASFDRGEYWCPNCGKAATVAVPKKGSCSWSRRSTTEKIKDLFTNPGKHHSRTKSPSLTSEGDHQCVAEGATSDAQRFHRALHFEETLPSYVEPTLERTHPGLQHAPRSRSLEPVDTVAQLPPSSTTMHHSRSFDSPASVNDMLTTPSTHPAELDPTACFLEMDSSIVPYERPRGQSVAAASLVTPAHNDGHMRFAPPVTWANFQSPYPTAGTHPVSMGGWPVAQPPAVSSSTAPAMPTMDPQSMPFLESLGTSTPEFCPTYCEEPEPMEEGGNCPSRSHVHKPVYQVGSGYSSVESEHHAPAQETEHATERHTPEHASSSAYGVQLQESKHVDVSLMMDVDSRADPLFIGDSNDYIAPLNIRPAATRRSSLSLETPADAESPPGCNDQGDQEADQEAAPRFDPEFLLAQAELYRCDFPGCDYRPSGNHPQNYHKYLRKHKLNHEGLKYRCGDCGGNYSRLDNLRTHRQRRHGSGSSESVESLGASSSPPRRESDGFSASEMEEDARRQKKRMKTRV